MPQGDDTGRRIPWWLIPAGVLLLAGFLVLLWKGPWWLDAGQLHKLGKDSGPKATVVTGFRTSIAASAVAAVAGTGIYFTSRTLAVTRQSLEVTRKTLEHTQEKDSRQEELTREGQVTDRYVKAVTLLASDKTTEQMGGVYALERVMRDSAKDHDTVVQLLAAYIREHAARDFKDDQPVVPTETVRAALTVLAHRPERPEQNTIDLTCTTLCGVDLTSARLDGVNLSSSRLDNARLDNVSLVGARLSSTSLRNIKAPHADLTDARLDIAVLRNADLDTACLHGADLGSTELQYSVLKDADLRDADLSEAQLVQPDGISGTTVVTSAQLLQAHVTSTTVLHKKYLESPELRDHIASCDQEYLAGQPHSSRPVNMTNAHPN
ncbi:pentapeptide repeat-containing protein [Streptomyces sp. NPDC004752]